MSDENNLHHWAKTYIDTFNAHDPQGLAALFDDNVVLRDWTSETQGKQAVADANANIFKSTPAIHAVIRTMIAEGRNVALELDIALSATDSIKVLDLITFNDQGKVLSVRAFLG